jgi:hypothetical protein
MLSKSFRFECLLSFISQFVSGLKECLFLADTYQIYESNLTFSAIKVMTQQHAHQWDFNRCIFILAHRLICQRSIINCTRSKAHLNAAVKPLPLIAITAATTTRNASKLHLDNLPAFTIMFPSLSRTLECGYRYLFVLGYDDNDSFYSLPEVCIFFLLSDFFRI